MLPKKKIGRKFFVWGIILFPLLMALYIVSVNSNTLLNETVSYILLFASSFSLVMLVTGIVFYFTGKDKLKRKFKKPLVALFALFATVYTVVGFGAVYELYFSGKEFKEWLITTAMTTMSHQYLATWFYNDYDVNVVLANNSVIETAEDTNVDLIEFSTPDFDKVSYANEYEKQVLTKDPGNDLYKIIDIQEKNFKGKLAVVYDPSKVKIGISKGVSTSTSLSNTYGQYITQIASNYGAVLAINGGGFYDPDWNSTGGVPFGVTISEGRLIANNVKAGVGGGIIGFNKDNKLVLARMSAQEALNAGIRDCVDFGPFLIVNGKSSYVNGNGGWGQAPRSAIGQRADGIVLLLAIDGRQAGSIGADMGDLTRVMLNYGAINAANLDGGTSSSMELNGQTITNPRNGGFQAKTRPVPTAFIVVK